MTVDSTASPKPSPFSPRRPRTRPPAEAAAPGPRRHPHAPPPCATPPARRPARFVPPVREKSPANTPPTGDSRQRPEPTTTPQPKQRRATPTGSRRNRGLSRLQEKPRQCTTDGRWWTAGRIGGNRNSPSGGAQPLSVVEGIVGLVVVVTAKAVLPGDVGLHRQSTPSGCPCGRLADNAGRSGPLQRWQEVRVTREQHHNVEVVVDCAKREVQTAAPRAAPPARRPCSERSGW